MPLLTLSLGILFGAICGIIGNEKGYNRWLCIAAGFFGGIVTLLLIILLPDQTQIANSLTQQDQELRAMAARIEELEARAAALEKNTSEEPPAEPIIVSTPDLPAAPVGTPVIFPARTTETIACPRCGKRQQGNRNFCYSCQTPFQYESE